MINKKQKSFIIRLIIIGSITALLTLAMANVKEVVNKSEAMRAMGQISQLLMEYRSQNGSLPPESYIEGLKEKVQGSPRLGEVIYRAKWIDYLSGPDTILAYVEKRYPGLLVGDGCVVIRLSGKVEWLSKEEFNTLMCIQRKPCEENK